MQVENLTTSGEIILNYFCFKNREHAGVTSIHKIPLNKFSADNYQWQHVENESYEI